MKIDLDNLFLKGILVWLGFLIIVTLYFTMKISVLVMDTTYPTYKGYCMLNYGANFTSSSGECYDAIYEKDKNGDQILKEEIKIAYAEKEIEEYCPKPKWYSYKLVNRCWNEGALGKIPSWLVGI